MCRPALKIDGGWGLLAPNFHEIPPVRQFWSMEKPTMGADLSGNSPRNQKSTLSPGSKRAQKKCLLLFEGVKLFSPPPSLEVSNYLTPLFMNLKSRDGFSVLIRGDLSDKYGRFSCSKNDSFSFSASLLEAMSSEL